MYWREFIHQSVEFGIRPLFIVITISFFLGGVTTIQTAYQLKSPFIPKSTVSKVVRDSIILELAPTFISIVLAGVIGGKIAGELGNMRVSEQIDALEMMGVNAGSFLILPKILAALLVIPCLIIISMVAAIWSGREIADLGGIVTTMAFDKGLQSKLNTFDISFALFKAYTFAFIISSIPSYFGYYVQGGAINIGKASNKAVILCCILILIGDYSLSSFFL